MRSIARALRFLLIVWGIAGSFLVLQFGLPELFNRVVREGWIPDHLVMPGAGRQNSSDTTTNSGSLRRDNIDPKILSQSKHLTWTLGFKVGFATGILFSATGAPPDMTSILNEQRVIADALGVQPPILPTIQHVANALHEFTQYVESDPQQTALQLARKYSEQHQFLYKFGAYCGYALVFRSKAPELGAVFVPQIRRYGRLIGIPTETWEPLTLDSLASLGGSDPRQKILDLINGIDRTVREIR